MITIKKGHERNEGKTKRNNGRVMDWRCKANSEEESMYIRGKGGDEWDGVAGRHGRGAGIGVSAMWPESGFFVVCLDLAVFGENAESRSCDEAREVNILPK